MLREQKENREERLVVYVDGPRPQGRLFVDDRPGEAQADGVGDEVQPDVDVGRAVAQQAAHHAPKVELERRLLVDVAQNHRHVDGARLRTDSFRA